MQQSMKRFLWAVFMLSGLQVSWGYSLAGPVGNGGDAWQTAVIGYGPPRDAVAPKNLGEEYRRNIPMMYYAFDQNFFDYFGPEGATAVSKAFTMLNQVTNVDNYSKQLTEVPLETRQQNYQAQALGLFDLGSATLEIMMEQSGLADAVTYTWNIHDRYHLSGAPGCPQGMEYLVVQRNYDITSSSLNQLQYSPYVNNVLYSYQILETCTGPNPLAIAQPYSADPLADTYSPVSSGFLGWGNYYTGLTRDDVAGLRYLYSTNNINWENSAAGSLVVQTNFAVQELFPTSITTNGGSLFNGTYYGTASYGALLTFANTNDAAAVQAAFPGVQLTQLTNYFATVQVTNTISYYTNYPGGVGQSLVVTKIVSTQIIEYFKYRFDNIFTNIFKTNTVTTIQKITVGPMTGAPAGSPLSTNVVTKKSTNNVPLGEFYILPTNSPCGVDIVSTLLTFTNYTTNIITSTTSSTNTTDTTTSTNTSVSSYTEIEIVPNIGHVYVIHPVTCDATNQITGLLRGIGRLSYRRADYDSLIGQYWQPITNDYTMTLVTNSKAAKITFRRIVTQPDFLFTAEDLTPGPDALPANFVYSVTSPPFDESNVLPGLAGPGLINPSTTISFNKAGPVYYNSYGDVMDGTPYFTKTPGGDITDLYYLEYFVWASFDGTTNAPVVFPNGTSIENLQNQVLIQVTPSSLPDATKGQYYEQTFSATGGAFSLPYVWTASNLPDGLSLSTDGDSKGVLSGTPTQKGTFDFTLTLTDDLGRSVQWVYTITIK